MTAGIGLLAVAACGGGGGSGGGGSITTASVPPAVVLQPPGTTVTYALDSVSATTSSGALAQTQLNPAGSGSSVTITSDANGNLSQIAFSIATPSTPFTPSFAGSQVSIAPPIDIVTLTNFLNAALSPAPTLF